MKKLAILAITTLSILFFNTSALSYNYNNYDNYEEDKRSNYGEVSERTGRLKTERVHGYTKKNGTRVDGYYRSSKR